MLEIELNSEVALPEMNKNQENKDMPKVIHPAQEDGLPPAEPSYFSGMLRGLERVSTGLSSASASLGNHHFSVGAATVEGSEFNCSPSEEEGIDYEVGTKNAPSQWNLARRVASSINNQTIRDLL